MFRNPRQNADASTATPVKPSTGRPPTPPNGNPTPQSKTPTMASRGSTKPLTPRANSKSNVPVLGRQTAKKPAAAKTPGKPNTSILSFFKKVDSPLDDDSIFKSPGAYPSSIPTTIAPPSVTISDDGDLHEVGDDESRFNESVGSVKRRKTTRWSTPSNEAADSNEGIKAAKDEGPPNEIADPPEDCSPPPEAPMPKPKPKKARRTGPFLSDSDTDDDAENQTVQAKAVAAEAVELGGAVLGQTGGMDALVGTKPIAQEDISENKPVLPEIESVVDVASRRLPTGESGGNTTHPPIPTLKKEATSADEWGKFEDLEDFPNEEEYVEGEEFSERRWMEEQAMLEAAEAEGESFDGFDDEPTVDEPPDEEMTAACPICSSSLKGVDPDLATRHVNGCLDGNPIPLPTPVKSKPLKVKYMPEGSKNRFARKAAIARPGQANPFAIGSTDSGPSSAFSKLMSGKAEDAAWASAAAAEHSSRGKPAYARTCPFYKIMPGFFICVDAFRYGAVQGCNAYFLSHFHSDHYIGLTSTWCHGPIYCSKITANLVKQQLRVDPKYVIPLEFEERFEVPGTQGVTVTMIPANHCPGSSLFLYEKVIGKGASPRVQRVLHCGDFRACPAHVAHPLLMPDLVCSITGKTKQQKIDVCYLDTTYLNPRYAFPPQEHVIQACADMCVSLKRERAEESDAWETMKRQRAGTGMTRFIASATPKPEDNSIAMSISTMSAKDRGRLLVVCGTYSIGKERICLGIARALDCKIFAPPGKMRICAALEDPELISRMTSDPREAQIHMQMLMELRPETLQEYLNSYKPHFSRVVGFRPSGWNYKPPAGRATQSPTVQLVLNSPSWRSSFSLADLVPQRGSTREASCFGVPYSEHSSFRELTLFVCALRIEKVIPTVNVGSSPGRAKMKGWIERWLAERRKNGVVRIGDEEGAVEW